MAQRLLLPVAALLATAGISLVAGQTPTASTPDKGSGAGDKPKWDITQPLGPTTPLAFDTDEGTWMNVDVSPDGRAGRLRPARRYLRDADRRQRAAASPSASRAAPAFDMQPRFSPDGKSIAFTSDRDGLWNIWIDGRATARTRGR